MTLEGGVLADRYAVGELLGRGGMAEVYRATDRVLDRSVALKVLGGWLAEDASFVERFRREALAAARVSHPNLVAIYDAGSEDGLHFIVMEHVAGRTLADALKADGPLDAASTRRVVRDLAAALAVVHRAGVVHRDVKPANVMLTPDGGTRLMDLGIARTLDGADLTRTTSVLGTPDYVSPEQARGDPVDARSDLYSLGCVAYEMLTGGPPFSADTPVAVAYRHVHEDPVAPSSVRQGVPAMLDALVLRAMAKDPADRFQSAEELLAALDDDTVRVPPIAPTRPLPVGAPAASGGRRADRRRRRGPLPILLAVAAILLLAATGFAVLGGGDPGARTDAAGGRSSPSPSPSVSPSRSPSRSPSPSPSPTIAADPVEAAMEDLFSVVDAGVLDGEIEEKAAEDLRHRANDAFEEFREGDTEKALDELADLREKVGEAVEHEEVAHSQEQKLVKAIEDVAEQMLRAAPPDDD